MTNANSPIQIQQPSNPDSELRATLEQLIEQGWLAARYSAGRIVQFDILRVVEDRS